VISLGEISLTLTSVRNITLLVSVLYVLATLVYQNRYTVNLEKGKRSSEYVKAYAEYDGLRREITQRGIVSRLPLFCAEYTASELKGYREGLLAGVSMSYKEYEERYAHVTSYDLKHKYRLSRPVRMAIIKAQRAKPIILNKNMILLNDGDATCREKPFVITSRKRQSRDYTANMVSRVLITLLSGAVAVELLVEPSLESLVQWCVRMVPVVSAALALYALDTEENIAEAAQLLLKNASDCTALEGKVTGNRVVCFN